MKEIERVFRLNATSSEDLRNRRAVLFRVLRENGYDYEYHPNPDFLGTPSPTYGISLSTEKIATEEIGYDEGGTFRIFMDRKGSDRLVALLSKLEF